MSLLSARWSIIKSQLCYFIFPTLSTTVNGQLSIVADLSESGRRDGGGLAQADNEPSIYPAIYAEPSGRRRGRTWSRIVTWLRPFVFATCEREAEMERKKGGPSEFPAKIAERFRDRVGSPRGRRPTRRTRRVSARREISSCRSFTSREGTSKRAVKIEWERQERVLSRASLLFSTTTTRYARRNPPPRSSLHLTRIFPLALLLSPVKSIWSWLLNSDGSILIAEPSSSPRTFLNICQKNDVYVL